MILTNKSALAAGISSRQVVDQEIELSTSEGQLQISNSQEIFYNHGKKLMDLAMRFMRCAKDDFRNAL